MPKTESVKTLKSFRLTDMTLRQLAELTAVIGASEVNIIAHAIDRMYQKEIVEMVPTMPMKVTNGAKRPPQE